MGLLGLLAALFVGSVLDSSQKKSPEPDSEVDALTSDERSQIVEHDRRIQRARSLVVEAGSQRLKAEACASRARRHERTVEYLFFLGFGVIVIVYVVLCMRFNSAGGFVLVSVGAILVWLMCAHLGTRVGWVFQDATRRADGVVAQLQEQQRQGQTDAETLERARDGLHAQLRQGVEARRVTAERERADAVARQRDHDRVREREQLRAAQEESRATREERDRAAKTLEAQRREIARLQAAACSLPSPPPLMPVSVPAPREVSKLPGSIRRALKQLPAEIEAEIERKTTDVLMLTALGDVKRQVLELRRAELIKSGVSGRDLEDDLRVLAGNLEKLDKAIATERGMVTHGPSR